MEHIHPPESGLKVLRGLEQAGHEAWFVGGCVRDSLLGRTPGDWDIATSALPEETKACFPSQKTVDTGIRHGTVTVLSGGFPVEVTTFRSDGEYTDSRHPDQVKFSRSLEEDLARRDFTVNALAWHPLRGLRDLFDGVPDLQSKTLRCVGDAGQRFSEDALRILRCFRFASVLNFSICQNTRQAALLGKERLDLVSRERVREELTKLLCGAKASPVLKENSQVLFQVLPELAPMEGCTQETPYHCFDVWEHTLAAVEFAPPQPVTRWAALLHDCGKPRVKTLDPSGKAHFYDHAAESVKIADSVLERLRFSNREKEKILQLVKLHGEVLPLPEKRVKKLLGALGEQEFFSLLKLMEADISAQAPGIYEIREKHLRQAESLAREILKKKECLTLKGLAVNGKDLQVLGFSPSRELGEALNALLEGVLSGSVPNKREALLCKAEELLSSHAV